MGYNVGKKITILATVCIIIVVVVFFQFYIFRLPTQQKTTMGVINGDLSPWVNKTVVREGNLNGPLILQGDTGVPYDYELNSSGQIIGLTFSANVNLTSFYGNQYFNSATFKVYLLNSSLRVRVYGIVRKGFLYGFNTPQFVIYYINVEKVELA